jgi:glycosyltransferase involved in cell wall biosynthesis
MGSKPRVLVVSRFPVGGIRTYLRDVFTANALRDYDFVLVAPNDEELDQYIRNGQLRCEWICAPSAHLAMMRTVAEWTRRLRPAFVHSHGFTSGMVSGPPCVLARLGHLLTVHDVLLGTQFAGFSGRMKKTLLGVSLGSPRLIHCVTNDSRDNLLRRYPLRARRLRKKIVVIQHGVDTVRISQATPCNVADRLGCSARTTVFGFLGRFMAQKGFGVLIDALEIAKKNGVMPEDARILAVGSGGFIREDRARISQLGLEDYFVFWPYQPDVSAILKGIHCLVMPSLWEASGLLAMEAMVAGTPVIGTSCIGLRETLADSPSVQVQPGSAEQLADALMRYLKAPHGNAARRFQAEAIARYSAERAFDGLRLLYERMSGK